MNSETRNRISELAKASKDANDFAKRGCEDGVFISMAEGRRVWSMKEDVLKKEVKKDV